MRPTAAAVLVSCLCGLLAGAGHSARRVSNAKIHVAADLRQLWNHGTRLFESGRYHEAATVFDQGLRQARARLDPYIRAQLLNNLAGARMAGFQYRGAVQALLEARDLATRQRDWKTVVTISSNLATAYSLMGELATARATAEQALALARQRGAVQSRLLVRVATLRARQGEFEAAERVFLEAARTADLEGDTRALAQVWRLLGYEHLRRKNVSAARPLLLDAFRQDRLSESPELTFSYRNLALLYAAEGDLVTAEHWMGLALERARQSAAALPLWSFYYERGRLRRERGRLAEALADFREAVDSARAWRLEALPAEAFAIRVDAGLQELYGALAETAAELACSGGHPSLAREAFEAAEENRAASLQARLEPANPLVSSLPPEYGDLLRQLHSLQAASQQNPAPALRARLEAVRAQLVNLELRAGLQHADARQFRWESAGRLLPRLQRALANDEAYLAFYLGETASFRWTVTRDRFRMDRLPPRSELAREAELFMRALHARSPAMERQGRRLYRLLFDGLSRAVIGKRKWFLALDSALFQLPIAALPEAAQGGRSVFLVERRAVQVVPGAQSLAQAGAPHWKGGFLGVADPVYNRADARRNSRMRDPVLPKTWRLLPGLTAAPTEPAELPRLPGSSKETWQCAAVWRGSAVRVLEGAAATPEQLAANLRSKPDVLHLATHVIVSEEDPARASIMLSLGPDGRLQSLSPDAIRVLRPAPSLVVLSGCRSARGPVLPGAGLLGLTRAWLSAGARWVVASLWATPDDSGHLFVRFYTHLQSLRQEGGRAPALALRQAQAEMLASDDWRSRPDYWAAYVVIGVL